MKEDEKKKKKGHQPAVAPIAIEPVQPVQPVEQAPLQDPPIPRIANDATVYGGGYGAESVSAEPTQPGTEIQPQPTIPIPSIDPNAEAKAAGYADTINAMRYISPARLKAQQQQNAMDIIRTMPLTDRKGDTISPTENPVLDDARRQLAKNSRLRSALGAAFKNMGENPRLAGARGWGDVFSGLAGGAGAGIAGGVLDSWDEEAKRIQLVEQLQNQIKENNTLAEKDELRQYQYDAMGQRKELADQRNDVQTRSLDLREARNKILNLKDEQKMLLEPIFKRGYFYEDDLDPQTREKMRQLGIVLPDFDTRHKPKQQNGQWFAYNPETRTYEPVEGLATDPDEVPMTFTVDGQRITASAKHFLGYAASKERQATQQSFQAGENDKNRRFQAAMEEARMQHRTALKQFDLANGRVKTLERAQQSYVEAYQKANGSPPSEGEISAHLAAIVSDLDNE